MTTYCVVHSTHTQGRNLPSSVADPYNLERIQIQDLKNFVTDLKPGQTLIRIRNLAKTKKDPDPEKKKKLLSFHNQCMFILLNCHFFLYIII